ncbi:MAG: hypothetical protein WC401_00630, partial [Bacteroidales bacterium]
MIIRYTNIIKSEAIIYLKKRIKIFVLFAIIITFKNLAHSQCTNCESGWPNGVNNVPSGSYSSPGSCWTTITSIAKPYQNTNYSINNNYIYQWATFGSHTNYWDTELTLYESNTCGATSEYHPGPYHSAYNNDYAYDPLGSDKRSLIAYSPSGTSVAHLLLTKYACATLNNVCRLTLYYAYMDSETSMYYGWGGGYMAVYVDGILVGSPTCPDGVTGVTFDFHAGADNAIQLIYHPGGSYPTTCQVDLVALYNNENLISSYPGYYPYNWIDYTFNGWGRGEGNKATVKWRAIPKANGLQATSTNICTGQSVTISPTTPLCENDAYINIEWATSSDFTQNYIADANSINPSPATTTTYYMRIKVFGGAGSGYGTGVKGTQYTNTSQITIYVTPSAAITLTSGNNIQSVCVNTPINNITYSTTDATGATFDGLPPGVNGNYAGGNITISGTPNSGGVYNYTVTAQGGCGNTTATGTITVNAPGTPTVGNNGPVCEGGTLALTASTIAGATYSWTGPNGFSSSEQNPTVSTSATIAMAGTYYVTATVGGCTGSAGSTIVTINPVPSSPVANNNGPICEGSTLSLTASTVTGATYSWTGPNGFTSSEQNPTVSTIATIAMSGTYSVIATVAG